MTLGKMGRWNIGNILLENSVKRRHKKKNPLNANPAKDGGFDFTLFHHTTMSCG
jgi:hypothetical protein